MKKILCLVLCLCMLTSGLCLNVFAADSLDEITSLYDYNGDGFINLTDARTVLRVSAGLEQPLDNRIYDLDGQDGSIPTINDVKIVISIVMGIDVEIASPEYLLALFGNELDSVKTTKPGFTKVATNQCEQMLVTTKHAPDPSLNVTNMPFDQYTNKTCDYIENAMSGVAGLVLTSAQKAEIKAGITSMRKEAKELYLPKTKEIVIEKRNSHYATFPVNNVTKSCYLKFDDIASITSVETEDGYILRTVKMKDFSYSGDEYPTGTSKASERREKIAYARIFNLPNLSDSDSILNAVTFKDGEIISKVDKLSGIPVYVKYSYTYVSDISTKQTYDKDGNPNLQMDSLTTAKVIEELTINPVTKN